MFFFQIDKKITNKYVDFSNPLENRVFFFWIFKYIWKNMNSNFHHLLGVEVDENYKGVVIKNGQKFIQ